MSKRNFSLIAIALALSFSVASCSDSADSKSASLPKSDLPDRFLLKAAPTDAKPVLTVRDTVQVEQQVAVAGRVKDFVDGLAVFTMTDPSLKSCDEAGPMEDCPTPWDYCCDDQTEIAKATATVEFRDGERPMKTGVRGFHGLDHLTSVVVTGKVRKDELGNLSVLADGLYIRPK